ncbi:MULTISPECIES: radical SAM protein [Thermotoga]|uniref:Radical SAM domain protein n=2 Tax=Thermotoga neapolitana TaxID=2337 RepID=B9KA44_THENN|nr:MULTISPECIES: radical SAM protein [Thermotoga]MDK2786370.1 putative pyruvate formate lyase activating enzyme [Thermotoga sp.]HBF10967.1 radical SAM protein [Thermotoga neapolitana]ACM23827.1 Radical SAM domain protein [Thermotoga neapolitana DSM 4359]AJG39858.1 radical SAM protein [Thermotoga sp. RQ7]MDK2949639.1 putative pyruvate formate lyase activating enzyme [Thermotoga sp.]
MKSAVFYRKLERCDICPRTCGVNRLKGEKGVCGVSNRPIVSSWGPHFGEERILVGSRGSGTVFFTFCNLKCVYCQNYEISQLGVGREITIERLAEIFVELQNMGVENLNLVTPTHQVPFIVDALERIERKIPVVYNCGGYESVETIEQLAGFVDIYMPDFKYSDPELGMKLSGVADYPQIAFEALKVMVKQTGEPVLKDGIMKKGVLVRHLILPGYIENSLGVIDLLSKIEPKPLVNIMAQFRPEYLARKYGLSRGITREEYLKVIEYAQKKNLNLIETERWLRWL